MGKINLIYIKIKGKMVARVTYRRQCAYNTRSNKIRKVRTPGGRLTALHVPKRTKAIYSSEPGAVRTRLGGLGRVRPSKLVALRKRERTVSRPYGGNLSGE